MSLRLPVIAVAFLRLNPLAQIGQHARSPERATVYPVGTEQIEALQSAWTASLGQKLLDLALKALNETAAQCHFENRSKTRAKALEWGPARRVTRFGGCLRAERSKPSARPGGKGRSRRLPSTR